MTSVWASAPGKVNRVLRVGAPLDNGYHPLVSVFEAVSLREFIELSPTSQPGIQVETWCYRGGELDVEATAGMADLPQEQHLAVRAVAALQPNEACGLRVRVHKTIPAAGGMAGGSADAAAALVAANELWSLGMTTSQLEKVARTLGADVPACLVGGLSVGVGFGDHMTPLPYTTHNWWVFAFSYQGLSTPEVFAAFDELGMGSALPDPDLVDAELLENDLTEAALSLRPELAEVGLAGVEAGATQWILSGSGPTVAAVAPSEEEAAIIARRWEQHPAVRQCVVAFGPVPGAQIEQTIPAFVHM